MVVDIISPTVLSGNYNYQKNQDENITISKGVEKTSPIIDLDIDSHLGGVEILTGIFKNKGSNQVIPETWEKTMNIQSRVIKTDKELRSLYFIYLLPMNRR